MFKKHPLEIAHHHQTLDSINARLGALLRHMGADDPGRDDELEAEMVLEDAMKLAQMRSPDHAIQEELEDM